MKRYFSTPPIFSEPVGSVDRDNNIIRGVTIARVGPAKGHEGYIDRTFLLQIVDLATTKTAGVKARFGHPNMCSTALGTYLGRFKNYSYSGDKVSADLYLDTTASNTPNGDLAAYVLDMAEKNQDMFGASIVFEIAESVFREEIVEGEKVKKEYFRLKDLRATDIVDDPAATDGLFSADTLPAMATQLLDENPQLAEFIFSKPENLVEFLTNYLNNNMTNFNEKLVENFKRIFSAKPPQQAISEEISTGDQFISFCEKFSELIPGIFSDENGNPKELSPDEKLDAILETWSGNLRELADARDQIIVLNEKLSARPSVPINVTDPQVSANLHTEETDDTGKQILANLPNDLKHKLKSQS